MKFSFTAEVDGQVMTLTAERIYRSKQAERYRLSITGTSYMVVVQSNRPAMLEKKLNKPAQWHLAEGTAIDKAKLEQVYPSLERALAADPKPIQGTLNFIDHF